MSKPPERDPAEHYDHQETETRLAALWEAEGLYNFDPDSSKPIYSVDTPPPYVSAAHLHVGHAMSYSQAEFIIRYKRMRGYNIFYPMGFDDNGLPTERFVEKKYGLNKRLTSRKDFRELCIKETEVGAAIYEAMWRALGLSVDWRLRYSTIDAHSRATAQRSFLDLYRKDLVYRANDPVLWDTVDETSLAQADLDSLERKGKLCDIRFGTAEAPLVISTTRPELIPACVALFHHPEDERYRALEGRRARVPLFDYEVPILQSPDVDPSFGTGLMMVCTFGDGEDVRKWREHKLETRLVIDQRGAMTELAGPYAGLKVLQARSAILKDLKAADLVVAERTVEQSVSVSDRSGEPIEFQLAPHWFVKVLHHREKFLARANELDWYPAYMKKRLEHWIEGLKYDWNISRQRFYGVPFPVWYVEETGEIILADEDSLPVDPTEDSPPAWALEKYKGLTIVGESDVMDTWMTSSLSPLINFNWNDTPGRLGDPAMLPMSVRVQAFEIIRTWLFYTIVKSEFHCGDIPWRAAMISGWGLNEQGKKISKRDLDAFTDAQGFNRYDPHSVIRRYGADALRYWASGSRLGNDLRYNEKDVRAGRKIVVKLWNVARLCEKYLQDFDRDAHGVALAERPLEDRWLVSRLELVVEHVTESFESFDYALGREALEKFFWTVLCDNYLEIVKDRFWHPEVYGETSRRAAQTTLFEALRILLGLFAPYLPFITDDIYGRHYADAEGKISVHVSDWPMPAPGRRDATAEDRMRPVLQVLEAWRHYRSTSGSSFPSRVDALEVKLPKPALEVLAAENATLRAALRCDRIDLDESGGSEDELPSIVSAHAAAGPADA